MQCTSNIHEINELYIFGYVVKGVYVYLDNILIFSNNKENYITIIKESYTRLRNEKLYLNRGKTMILLKVLDIQGHTIKFERLSSETVKVLDVKSWLMPNNRKKLQGFIGIVNCLFRYTLHLASATTPLIHLCGYTIKWQWLPIHNTGL